MQLDPATIIFALLAVFVLWKLRAVLGERTGTERPPFNPFAGAPQNPVDAGPVGANPSLANPAGASRWTGFAEDGDAVWRGLDAIAAAQPGFSAKAFLDGAQGAYEMVLRAFAGGDRAALQRLASQEVFESFSRALDEREARGESQATAFVGMNGMRIAAAQITNGVASIAVRFDAKLITATRDKSGVIVDGDPANPVDIVDHWIFARRNDSRDPNWTLIATAQGQ